MICDRILWKNEFNWNSTQPTFGPCIDYVILPVIPLIVLILTSLLDLRFVFSSFNKRPNTVPLQWRNSANFIFIMILIIISLVSLLWKMWKLLPENYYYYTLSETIIDLINFFLALIISAMNHRIGRLISLSLPFFWFFSIIVSLIRLNNNDVTNSINDDNDLINRELKLSLFSGLSFILLILSNISDKPRKQFTCNNYNGIRHDSITQCPIEDRPLISRITFFWIFKYLIIGLKNRIEINQLMPLCSYLRSDIICERFERIIRNQQIKNQLRNSNKLSLVPLLWSQIYHAYLYGAFFELISITASYGSPFILSLIIDYLSSDEPNWHGIVYCIGFTTAIIIDRACDAHQFYFMFLAAIKAKSLIISVIYRKIFRMSALSRREYTAGEINNLMSIDSEEIYWFIVFGSLLYSIPIRVFVNIFFMWQYLGSASLMAILVILITCIISAVLTKKLTSLEKISLKMKGQRLQQTNEILNGIKVLKLYSWELPFMKRLNETRAKELNALKKYFRIDAVFHLVWCVVPMILSAVTFMVYLFVNSDGVFDAKTAFVSIALFNLLRAPTAMIHDVISRTVRARVCFKRLSKFLNSEELLPDSVSYNSSTSDDITFNDATLTWDMDNDDHPVLKNIKLSIPQGSLIAVIGTVGSGKSTLFSAIIGEIYKLNGDIKIAADKIIAYVPQQAWIQNSTVKDNIVFLKTFEQNKYNNVISSCALNADFQMLTHGDLTEIGDRGVNLSGGQKQRISLARAVYHDADIYLLDDPLSAVDAHVAQHLFTEVIGPSGVLKSKTRILATHNISFLKSCDKIVIIDNGEIIAQGTYDQLKSDNSFSDIIIGNVHNLKESTTLIDNDDDNCSNHSKIRKLSESNDEKTKINSTNSTGQDIEQLEIGVVPYRDYFKYCLTMGIWIFIFGVICDLSANGAETGATYWISQWIKLTDLHERKLGLALYSGLVIIEGLLVYSGSLLIFGGGLRAARTLHEQLLYQVLRAPLHFFDITPIGRVLNRFSRDMSTVDRDVPLNFQFFVMQFTYVPLMFIMICFSSPYMVITLILITVFYYLIYKLFLWGSRQLKRLESITRSPIFCNYNESIYGRASIRAYNAQSHFIDRCNKEVDLHINCQHHQLATIRWMEVAIQLVSACLILSTSLTIVLNRHNIEAGIAGMVLTYLIMICTSVMWMIRVSVNIETQMIAVERVREYIALKSEALWSLPNEKLPQNWPSGPIEYRNYSTSYRPGLELVLKNLNFSIGPNEKVGIVGRTGAGKSSLALSLFRIIEPTEGTIIIDGIDITTLGLHDLRSKLTVIPQDPVLFGGTIRFNLDPFNEHDDGNIWNSLKEAHLDTFINNTNAGLEYEIVEGGDNLSSGQRQLVCLSRAILRNSKILVLDEATASLDIETDKLIQLTIREQFDNCAVITIAHRINTVLDYDRIVVMDNGKIIEIGEPPELLKDENSQFYQLAKDSGNI